MNKQTSHEDQPQAISETVQATSETEQVKPNGAATESADEAKAPVKAARAAGAARARAKKAEKAAASGEEPAGNRHARRAEKVKARKAKKSGEPAGPLPDEPEPAQETPKGERSEEDYPAGDDDIFADEGDDDDLSDAAPSLPKLLEKLPKAKYVRFRPGAENRTALYTIKLDEEDRRPGEMESYILTKAMRDYLLNHLNYKVRKQIVIDAITLQGDQFMYMYPASAELSGNSWITSRNRMIMAGMEGWIIISTDLKAHEYTWRVRKAHHPEVKFSWPAEPIKSRALKAVDGPRLIASPEHAVVRRLEGETDTDNGEE
jgi:hypothetical protein